MCQGKWKGMSHASGKAMLGEEEVATKEDCCVVRRKENKEIMRRQNPE